MGDGTALSSIILVMEGALTTEARVLGDEALVNTSAKSDLEVRTTLPSKICILAIDRVRQIFG